MRFGINGTPDHRTPEEWGDRLAEMGFNAAAFPVNYQAPVHLIDGYVKAAEERDIMIAEVGVWKSPFSSDAEKAKEAAVFCEEQFRLADYVKAKCCVNVSGAAGETWYGCYPENFTEELYQKNVEFIQVLCDKVKPRHTFYTLEPMQWMAPDSPEQYLRLLKDVDRERFAVHMDLTNFIKDPYTYTHKKELIEKSFRLLGAQTKSCHLKDCLLEDGTTVVIWEVLMGEGTMEVAEYLDAIAGLNGEIPVLLEHLPDMHAYQKAAEQVRAIYPPLRRR